MLGLGSLIAIVVATASPPPKASRWSAVETGSTFKDWRRELQQIVDAEARVPVNHFCLVVETWTPERGPYDQRAPERQAVAYVLWKERRQVREWDGEDDRGHMLPPPGSAVIDLDRDIAPDATALRGSTFMQSRSWVRSLQRRCAAQGTHVIVRETGH